MTGGSRDREAPPTTVCVCLSGLGPRRRILPVPTERRTAPEYPHTVLATPDAVRGNEGPKETLLGASAGSPRATTRGDPTLWFCYSMSRCLPALPQNWNLHTELTRIFHPSFAGQLVSLIRSNQNRAGSISNVQRSTPRHTRVTSGVRHRPTWRMRHNAELATCWTRGEAPDLMKAMLARQGRVRGGRPRESASAFPFQLVYCPRNRENTHGTMPKSS